MEKEFFGPDIFLAYANVHIRDSQSGLTAILRALKESKSMRKFSNVILKDPLYIDRLLDMEAKFNEPNFYKIAAKVKAESDKTLDISNEYDALLKISGAHCKCRGCSTRNWLRKVHQERILDLSSLPCSRGVNRKRIFDPSSLQCYECDHKIFVYQLNELTRGEEYSKIIEFKYVIENCYHFWPREFSIVESDRFPPYKETIKISYLDFQPGLFNEVTDSLITFLINDDRRKLKKCQQCGSFFVSKTLRENQKFCSEKCSRNRRWPKEKWNEYIKEYRRALKIKKLNDKKVEREKYINEMMKNTGWPRKEIIEMLEADNEI